MSDAQLLVKIGTDVDVDGLKQFGKELDNLSGGSVPKATISIRAMEDVLKDLKVSLKDASGQGLITINQQVKGLEDALKQAKTAGLEPLVTGFGHVSNAASLAYGEIRKLAYILPGIGIGGIFAAIFSVIESAFVKTDDTIEQTKKAAAEAQKAIESTIGSFAKESGQVDVLVNSLKRGNLTHLETRSAIEALQKISPEYFGNLDKEKLSIDVLTKSYQAYNAQITTAIETQLKMKDITDIITKRLDFERNAKDASAEFNSLLAAGKSLADIAKIANDRINEQSKANVQLLQSEKGRYATGKDLIGGLGIEATALLHIVQYRQQEQDILDTISKYGKISLKDIQAVQVAVQEISKAHINFSLADIPTGEAESIISKALHLDKDIKVKVPIGFENDLREAGVAEDDIKTVIKQVEADASNLRPTIRLRPDLELDFAKSVIRTENVKELEELLNKAAQKFAVDAAVAISEGIGAALGGAKNPFASFAVLLGNALEQLGKELIVFSGIFKGIKIAIENAIYDPTLLAVAGVAAVVAGAALKASIGKGIHAFAEGGVVTGPTVGLVGEAGPEVIFPLNKINQFVNGIRGAGQSGFVAETQLSGDHLRILINRANRNQGLV